MTDFTHVWLIGTLGGKVVDVEVRYHTGKLAMTGTVSVVRAGSLNRPVYECVYGGQIVNGIDPSDISPADGWTVEAIEWLWRAWKRWHLNDMRAGTPAQERLLRTKAASLGVGYTDSPHAYASSHGYGSVFQMHQEWLKDAGIVVDGDYAYGTRWLREEVPVEVLAALNALPALPECDVE